MRAVMDGDAGVEIVEDSWPATDHDDELRRSSENRREQNDQESPKEGQQILRSHPTSLAADLDPISIVYNPQRQRV